MQSCLKLMEECQNSGSGMRSFASQVWRSLTPPKSELLLWFLVQGKLNTKERLHRLNIQQGIDISCVLCQQGEETSNHLFC